MNNCSVYQRMFRTSLVAIFVLILSCNNGKDKPDVADINVTVPLERFEQLFFSIDTNNLGSSLQNVAAKSAFYTDFMQNILQVRPYDTSAGSETVTVVKNFIGSYKPIYDSIEEKYTNLDWLKEDLTDAFKYVKYYYPNYKVPKAVTFIAPLDAPGAVLTTQYLGIGLHQYAGKNFSVYQSPEIQQLYPTYISRRFDKEYIVANSMKAIVDDVYPDQSVGRPLVEQMIEKGKQWFLLDHFLPDAPDSVKTGYTKKQLDWVEENEGNAWSYILKNENLYSIEPVTIQTYIGEAPFTQVMPESSPGNLGQWIGWRIIQEFASKNETLTVQQILQTPAKTIFESAKYRPK